LRNIASFACAILLIVVVPVVADGATIQVSSNLQGAIDAASSGDTLLVAPGAYEKITIGKSLKLIGNGAVIRAGDRDACVSVEADGVEISGFLVRDGFYGIKLDNVKGCKLDNNTVIRCVQPGIALLFSNATMPASTALGAKDGTGYIFPIPTITSLKVTWPQATELTVFACSPPAITIQ